MASHVDNARGAPEKRPRIATMIKGKRTSGGRPSPELEARLDAVADAFDAQDFARALAGAEEVLAQAPGLPEALHFKAAALLELDQVDAAVEVYAQAVKVAPDDLELLLSAADCLVTRLGEDREAVEEGLRLCARGKKVAQRADDVEMLFELLVLEGIGLNQLGEAERALAVLDEALAHAPRSVDARLERAIALFELCRFEDARAAFEVVLRDAPDEPYAHHHLGLLAERRGDEREAKRRFERAQRLAPEDFPPPVTLGDEEFDAAVEAAVAQLPGNVKKYLDNVTIAVEDIPSDEDLTAEKPPLSPSILGVFRGTPVGERSVTSSADHFPAAIVLYQHNLERFARTREELIEQIGITLMHEVGHLIGLDEEDLWERGLD